MVTNIRLAVGVALLLLLSAAGCARTGSGRGASAEAPRVMLKNAPGGAAVSRPRFYVEHADVGGRLFYFFSVTNKRIPVLETAEDFPLPIALQPLGHDRFRVRIDLVGQPAAAGRWPEQGAYEFTLRYADGSAWDRSAEYSALSMGTGDGFVDDLRMPLYDSGGALQAGEVPPPLWLAGAFVPEETERTVQLKNGGADVTPPQLTLDAYTTPIEGRNITLTGSAIDAASGLADVVVTSDRQDGQRYVATLAGGSQFSVVIPLAPGVNALTFTAADHAGNQRIKRINVKRVLPPPQIVITQPADGLVTNLKLIDISGTISADPDDAPPVISSGGVQVPAQGGAVPGAYTFALQLPIQLQGLRAPKVTVTSAYTSAQTQLHLLVDWRPPQITVNKWPPAKGGQAMYTFTGSVDDGDGGSGASTVTATCDCMPGQIYAGSIAADGTFTLEMPLAHGANLITFAVVDIAGNVSHHIAHRWRPRLGISIISPVEGVHVTSGTVSVAGTVDADPADAHLRVILRGYRQAPVPTGTPGLYTFRFDGISLVLPGLKTVRARVESDAGGAWSLPVSLFNDTPNGGDDTGPILTVQAPLAGSTLNEDSVTVAGQASDPSGISRVAVNGVAASLTTIGGGMVDFQQTISLAAVAQGPFALTVAAHDARGNITSKVINLTRDSVAPVIALTAPIPTGDLLHAIDNPLLISGVVSDTDLAGFSINDESQPLTPGSQSGQYLFSVRVPVQFGEETPVRLLAWDRAGNQTAQTYRLLNDASLQVEIISPRDGSTVTLADDGTDVPVVARANGAPADVQAGAMLGTRTTALAADGGSYTGKISADGLSGAQQLAVTLKSASGQVLANASSRVTVDDARNAPVALLRTDPSNGASGTDPSAPISLYFNRAIDPSQLAVSVTETVHGQTYDPAHPQKMMALNLDQSPVIGSIALLPGLSTATFYSSRTLNWGSTILLTVSYAGAELARIAYQVHALPTLVQGVVADQFRQPAGGITVTLPQLGLSTATDGDGNYSFGFGDDTDIPAGRYRLIANPGLQVQPLGTLQTWTTLQAGHYNHQAPLFLPIVNPQVPFVHVASGQGAVPLAASDLQLDLTGAQLRFPNLRPEGEVHVQFVGPTEIPVAAVTGSAPLWAYAAQPPGIVVSGQLGVQINPPTMHGSTSYLPPDGNWVLLVGYDDAAGVLKPAGAAQVQNRRIVSVGPNVFTALDYIGVVLAGSATAQTALAQYAAGSISLGELTRRLTP